MSFFSENSQLFTFLCEKRLFYPELRKTRREENSTRETRTSKLSRTREIEKSRRDERETLIYFDHKLFSCMGPFFRILLSNQIETHRISFYDNKNVLMFVRSLDSDASQQNEHFEKDTQPCILSINPTPLLFLRHDAKCFLKCLLT